MQLDLDSKKKRGAAGLSTARTADNLSTRTEREREREKEGVKLLGARNTLFGCASCGLLLLLLGSVEIGRAHV